MKLKPNYESMLYKNDDYKVFNVKPYDHLVDTLILACSEDESEEQLLIPVDKAILVNNIPFFTAMFREDSNWIEGKANVDQDSEKFESCSELSAPNKINWKDDKISKSKRPDGSQYLTLKMIFPHKIKPLFFAKFLKSLYTAWMDISEKNCIEYYRVVDYLQDETTMNRITNFINKNITFENSIDLLALTDKFDESINKFYMNNDVDVQEMTTLINYVEKVKNTEPTTFIKVIQNLRKKLWSSACVEILKVYLSNQEITSCKSDTCISKIISQIKCLFTTCSIQEKFLIYNRCLDIVNSKNQQIYKDIYKDIFCSDLNDSKSGNTITNSSNTIFKTNIQLLCQAILDDSEASIKLLRKYCHDKNRQNDMKNARTIKALSQISGVKTRIEAKRVGSKRPDGLEIVDVCENGQIEMLKAILQCGADIDRCELGGTTGKCRHIRTGIKRYYQNYSPLVMACYSKRIEIVKLLLSKKYALHGASE